MLEGGAATPAPPFALPEAEGVDLAAVVEPLAASRLGQVSASPRAEMRLWSPPFGSPVGCAMVSRIDIIASRWRPAIGGPGHKLKIYFRFAALI